MERNWKIPANRSKHPNGIDRGLIYPVLIRKVIPKLFFWRKTCCITEISCSIKRTLMIVEEIITIPLEQDSTTRHKTHNSIITNGWRNIFCLSLLKQCSWMFWGFMTTESNNGEILRLLFLIDFGIWNQLTIEHLEALQLWAGHWKSYGGIVS